MSEKVQPNWIDLTHMATAVEFEEQMDVNAGPGSPNQYRHRKRRHTGDPDDGWVQGLARANTTP